MKYEHIHPDLYGKFHPEVLRRWNNYLKHGRAGMRPDDLLVLPVGATLEYTGDTSEGTSFRTIHGDVYSTPPGEARIFYFDDHYLSDGQGTQMFVKDDQNRVFLVTGGHFMLTELVENRQLRSYKFLHRFVKMTDTELPHYGIPVDIIPDGDVRVRSSSFGVTGHRCVPIDIDDTLPSAKDWLYADAAPEIVANTRVVCMHPERLSFDVTFPQNRVRRFTKINGAWVKTNPITGVIMRTGKHERVFVDNFLEEWLI